MTEEDEKAPVTEDPVHPAVEGPETALGEERHLEAEVERLRGALERAEREAAENLEKARRALADFDNFRKRARGDAQAARDKAREELLAELLGVLDNFDRAMEHAGDEESLYEGVKLIFRQFRVLLEKQGLTRIDTEGHPFDPLVHEAVMREPTRSYSEGTIIKELERGYFLNGKVLRAAKVKVAVAPDEDAKPQG